jgi:7,8-dihydropterin-6-yl-methyl-4-(beta-D-ribofuranosyl)aminobenzene 5'-phosphate synthase
MEQGMDRRAFLKLATATGAALIAGDTLGESATAGNRILVPETEKIIITVITDNYTDFLKAHDKIARRPFSRSSPLDMIVHAEHGLAYHVETLVKARSHAFLFDFGSIFSGVNRNLALLKIDMRKIEAMALSHNHFDHQAALSELLHAYRTDLPPGIPFYIGEEFFLESFMSTLNGFSGNLLSLKREDIEGLGLVKIIEVKHPTPIVPGACLMGKIEKVTDYENGSTAFLIKQKDQFIQDDFVCEQAIVLNARGKGLVVLASCAHRGIVNTVRQAQRITGIRKVHAVIGGFHLSGAKPDVVQKTIADLKTIRPDYIVPLHCTGSDVITTLKRAMPDQFIMNTAGTQYIIT